MHQRRTVLFETTFDASRLTSGVYFYNLSSGTYTAIKNLLLLE